MHHVLNIVTERLGYTARLNAKALPMFVFLPTTWGGSGVPGGLVGCGRRVFLGAGVVVVVVVVVAVMAVLVVVVGGATVVVVVVFALLSVFFVVLSPLATLIAK